MNQAMTSNNCNPSVKGVQGHQNAGGGCAINVGEEERQLSMIGGSILGVYGLLRGSVTGWALAALGAALVYRGHTGHCSLYEAMGHSSASPQTLRNSERQHPKSLEQQAEPASQPS